MPYATQQDLIDRFGQQELIQLTDRADPPAGVIDATVVDAALAGADNIINGYVAARYALPLSPAPELLTDLAADIARYRLYEDGAPEDVRTRYDDAVTTLRRISKGEVVLPVAGNEPKPPRAEVIVEGPGRVFSRPNMAGL